MHYQDGHVDRARADWELSRSDFVAAGDANGEFEVVDDIENSIPGLERRPYAERCLAIAREQQDPLLEARARERWGGGLLDAGLAGPALIELERAASVMRPLGRRADPHFGDTLAMLGWALREHGAFDRAVPVHREAIRTAQARGDLDSLMWNYFGLGVSLAELGHMAEAEAAARRGLEVARAKGASTNIRLLMQSLGGVQVKRRRWQEAISTLETAQAMPGVVTTAMPLVHLSESYRAVGRLDEALDRASRAADLARQLGMVDNELQALIERAHVLAAKGRDGGVLARAGPCHRAPRDVPRQPGARGFSEAGVRRALHARVRPQRRAHDAARPPARGAVGGRAREVACVRGPAGRSPRARNRRCGCRSLAARRGGSSRRTFGDGGQSPGGRGARCRWPRGARPSPRVAGGDLLDPRVRLVRLGGQARRERACRVDSAERTPAARGDS